MLRFKQIWTCEHKGMIHGCLLATPKTKTYCGLTAKTTAVVATSTKKVTCSKCKKFLVK